MNNIITYNPYIYDFKCETYKFKKFSPLFHYYNRQNDLQINNISKWDKTYSITEIYNEILTPLDECFFERANYIINRAKRENKRVALLWSGGIDSTTALVELNKVDKTIVDVFYTESTFEESLGLDNFFKKENNFFPLDFSIMNEDNYIYVTGSNGDHLLSSNFLDRTISNIYNKPTDLGISEKSFNYINDTETKNFIKENILDGRFTKFTAKVYLKLINEAPFKIRNNVIGIWYYAFVILNQSMCLKIFHFNPDKSKNVYINNYEPFYNSKLIQRYTLDRMEKGLIDQSKNMLKDIIVEYTKNINYYNKKKHPSWQTAGKYIKFNNIEGFLLTNEGRYILSDERILI